jgi:N-acylneuraminate cytidylyltransferase
MKSLAFIPARGGSKRLPGKNIKLFGGLPLIYYSIAFAKYNQFSKIIVSTDDDAIAEVAKLYGAEVLIRPKALATDIATTAAAARHCLNSERARGFDPEVFITLQPTNPLRPFDLYRNAMVAYSSEDYDSVISVGLNKHKLGVIQNELYIPQTYTPGDRSQDLDKLYYENGLIYLTKPAVIESEDVFGKRIRAIITPAPFTEVDIDDESDFELGENILNIHKEKFDYLVKA